MIVWLPIWYSLQSSMTRFNLFNPETNGSKNMWSNVSKWESDYSLSLLKVSSLKKKRKRRKNKGTYKRRRRICSATNNACITADENRTSEFPLHLDALIKNYTYNRYFPVASPKFVMNRETYCIVSYHCSSLWDKNIDLFHWINTKVTTRIHYVWPNKNF